MKPNIGDERFLLEILDTANVTALAKKEGWTEGESFHDFCEPQDAALYFTCKTIDVATAKAREYLAKGTSLYGCVIIDRQVFEDPHDDRGNSVDCPPCWERHESYEVAMDGECITVDR